MAATLYQYTQEVDIPSLDKEIKASDITIALDRIELNGTDELRIYFKATLSASEKAILDYVLSKHTNTPLVENVPHKVQFSATHQESDDDVPFVYASARPMDHYTYFTSRGDTPTKIGEGDQLIYNILQTDSSKSVEVTFNEDVYLKDGLVMATGAPFGATVTIDVIHPVGGLLLSFAKNSPIFGDFPIAMDTEDRAYVPKGLILRITINNSTGVGMEDAPASFKVIGRLELYRPKPPGT